MRRRAFLAVAAALPATAAAQARLARIALLAPVEPPPKALPALRDSLRDKGFVEKRDFMLEVAWPAPSQDLAALTRDVVRRGPDLIVAWTTPASLAAKQATSSIPIVIVGVADPVGVGLVHSLARPGGNVTGFSNISADIAAKQVEIFSEVIPQTSRLGVIYSAGNPAGLLQMRGIQEAMRKLQFEPIMEQGSTAGEYVEALQRLRAAGVGGVVFPPNPTVIEHRQVVAQQARDLRLPTMFQRLENVEAGGLMSYGPDLTGQFRQVAGYVERILKGTKAADLPVMQPEKIEFIVNLRTAKEIGLHIPEKIVTSADELIE
jgi:putative ABC transport system substrate-binding protein